MIIIHQVPFLTDFINKQRKKGLSIGFVPTMGALHDGHLQLVNHSASACDVTVCSIFVNPTQFNEPADFQKYPVTLENDIRILAVSKANLLFLPTVSAIYPSGTTALEHYDLDYLETILEGKYRPGHFQGVCQVMKRLLEAVMPDMLFMGQKDYQQCMVIKRLIEILQLNIKLVTCPTVRENNGLAMSSRNMRLSAEERAKAPLIFQTLTELKNNLKQGNTQPLKQDAARKLENVGFRVDYIEIADASNLEPVKEWKGTTTLVALVAAFLGDVRLIDNMLLNK